MRTYYETCACCPSPTYGAKYCSQACADLDAYDTLDEREIAFARDDRELERNGGVIGG